jgi:hypothetical protein
MIAIEGGWAQWDYQIGTYRAEVNGVIYGVFTDEISTVNEFEAILGVEFSEQDRQDLEAEKSVFE